MRHEGTSEWLSSMRGKRTVKILSGIRGVGKSSALAAWRDELLASGVPEERVVCVDAEEPVLRHLVSADDVLRYLATQLPESGPVIMLIDEPGSFPDYEKCIGELLGQRRLDIYLTLSSSRLVTGGLSDYLRGAIAVREMIPPPEGIHESPAKARARWNEIMLRDVLSEPGISDVGIAESIAAYLADAVGDPISLRMITAAISPPGKCFSPNTADAYLTALEHAHVVEKCYRWSIDHEEPLGRRYRVFFTDPMLRLARFGLSPDEDRRSAINQRWLEMRRKSSHVYLPEDDDLSMPFDFIIPEKPPRAT